MRVTIRQIAEESGVSRGTVDRVLNNRGKVRPEVEERVRKVAEELGYKPNLLGRALIKMKENIKIGVILQDTGTPYLKRCGRYKENLFCWTELCTKRQGSSRINA